MVGLDGGRRPATLSTVKLTTVSHDEARRFYDRFGAKQDSQGFYEDAATDDLRRHADFSTAASVVEFGCGTGRFAETILDRDLPADAKYLGVDVSSTMIDLARKRLARFGERVMVRQSDGTPSIPASWLAPATADRFVSNYVLDLLSDDDIAAVLTHAHRVLADGGLLALVSLTHGWTWGTRAVERAWSIVYGLRPLWLGGCRPLDLREFVAPSDWSVVYQRRIARFGIPSEVLVAAKRTSPDD